MSRVKSDGVNDVSQDLHSGLQPGTQMHECSSQDVSTGYICVYYACLYQARILFSLFVFCHLLLLLSRTIRPRCIKRDEVQFIVGWLFWLRKPDGWSVESLPECVCK